MSGQWGTPRAAREGWAMFTRNKPGWGSFAPKVAPNPNPMWAGRVGFGVHTAYDKASQSVTDGIMDKVQSTGARWVRDEFEMSDCNPAPGVFNWTYTDRLMRSTAQRGITVAAVVAYGVQWSSGQANIKYPPQAADYAAFCAAIATRYGSTGTFWQQNPSVPRKPLGAVILWNEPWLNRAWLPEPSPAGYCALVRAGSAAIRAVDTGIKLLMSVDPYLFDSQTNRSSWLTALFAADSTIHEAVDAFQVHLYNNPKRLGPYDPSDVNGMNSTERYLTTLSDLAALGRSKPVWVTEVGWNTNPDGGQEYVTQAAAAQFVEDILVRAMQQWNVPRIFLFGMHRYAATPGDPLGPSSFGMLNADGSEMPSIGRVRTYLSA